MLSYSLSRWPEADGERERASGQQYLDLLDDHVFAATTGEEAVEILWEGTGVIYFGFP